MHFTIKFLMLIILTASVSGCAYGGFPKRCSELFDDEVAYRQCVASQGNQQAQYELGLEAFNVGDTKLALKWLKRSAQKRPSRLPVYVPPVGNISAGRVMLIDTNNGTNGNVNAQLLLSKIYKEGLGVEVDENKAQKYRDM